MNNFIFQSPTKIIFGKDQIQKLPEEINQFGKRILLVYGGGSIKKNGIYNSVIGLLEKNNIEYKELSGVQPNPRISSVREGVKLCREHSVDFILAVGGGSVIDCSKAIAAAVPYNGDAWDFMKRKAKVRNPLPIGSVLTLAATGSEMNGGAVISNDDTQEKLPMGDSSLTPRFSILDPTHTFSVNRKHTAAGVVDIMSHVFEQYFSLVPETGVQDRIAEGLLKTCIEYGPRALEDPDDYDARANLMWTSSLALNDIISTGKNGDWATHMIEHEVSAIYDLTHGVGLGIITPNWMQYVLNDENVVKFATYAKNVWGFQSTNPFELAHLGIEKTRSFFTSLDVPATLSEVNIPSDRFEEMAEKAIQFGEIGLFKKLGKQDIMNILNMCK